MNKRKLNSAFYNFHLLTIFQGDLIEILFKNKQPSEVKEITEIKYLNRHIVNNKEDFYRVRFIKSNEFHELLNEYDDIHKLNVKFYSNLRDDYYLNYQTLKGGIDLFKKEVIEEIRIELEFIALIHYDFDNEVAEKLGHINIKYQDDTEELSEIIKKDEELLQEIKNIFIKWYRFKGVIKFKY